MRRPVLVLLLLMLAGTPIESAPLHPRLGNDPAVRAAIPPEPVIAPVDGAGAPVATLAARFGRRFQPAPRLLLLLVDFVDRPADPGTHPPAYYQDLYFSDGVMEYGSLQEYYRTVSHGRMEVTGEAFGWYRMPRPYSEYAAGASGLCFVCGVNARTLAVDALAAARIAGIDVTRFDQDADGILDGLMVVFAGYGAERTGSVDDIRSHYLDFASPREESGILIPDYVAVPELENIGIAVHELGHLWGGEDLYDLTGRGGGIGNFSIMAHGVWFNNGRSPGGPDPFTRILWGLVEPETPGADEPGLEIPSSAEVSYALRLWTRGEPGPEYFLVENRRPGGIDRFLAGDGLLVYHVDETQRTQSNRSRYRVSVVQADGLRSLEGIDTPSLGDAGDFFPGRDDVRTLDDNTVPGTRGHDGSATRVALRNIGDPGPRVPVDVAVGRYIGTGPAPALEIVLPEGASFPVADPGGSLALGVRLRNRGTRMGPGQVTVFSRDPRVRVPEGLVIDVPGVASLGRVTLGMPVPVTLRGEPANRVPVVLEARWTGETGSVSMATAIPRPANLAGREGFEAESPRVTTRSLNARANPWSRSGSGAYEGNTYWSTRGYGDRTDAGLELGPYTLSGYSEVRFHHTMHTQADGEWGYDGGFLEMSLNNGERWTLIHPAGGYPGAFLSTTGNPHAGTPAWSGSLSGWREVIVPIEAQGDARFRFRFVSDFTGSNGLYLGWSVDGFEVRSFERPHTALFDPPNWGGEPPELQIGFSVVSLFETPGSGAVRLVREGPGGRAELGFWGFSGREDITIPVAPPGPGYPERFWLEWEEPGLERVGPLVVVAPGAPVPWFSGSPGVIRRSDGGGIRYVVPGTDPVFVRIDLFDIRGTRVAVLASGMEYPGLHTIPWPAHGRTGRTLTAGVYFIRASGGGTTSTHRIVLVP